jgi:hypothetical protein
VATAELSPYADAIWVELRKAHPGEVEKGELADQTQLMPNELRQGLNELREAGMLNENGEQFAAVLEGDGPDFLPDAEPDEDEPGEVEEPPEYAGHLPPGPSAGDASYRAGLMLVVSYGARPGEDEEGSLKRAEALAAATADVMAQAMPGLAAEVRLEYVDKYSEPQRIFAGGSDQTERSRTDGSSDGNDSGAGGEAANAATEPGQGGAEASE